MIEESKSGVISTHIMDKNTAFISVSPCAYKVMSNQGEILILPGFYVRNIFDGSKSLATAISPLDLRLAVTTYDDQGISLLSIEKINLLPIFGLELIIGDQKYEIYN